MKTYPAPECPGEVVVRFDCDAVGCSEFVAFSDNGTATEAFRWGVAVKHYGWSGNLNGPHYCRTHGRPMAA